MPWFWSNQYELRLQTIGLSTGYDATILRDHDGADAFSIVYLRAGQVIALDCVNATKDYVQGRKLVTGRVKPDPMLLAQANRPLNDPAFKHAEP